MTIRRMTAHALLILAIVAGITACQSSFTRACLQSKDCERTPVNGPSVLGVESVAR